MLYFHGECENCGGKYELYQDSHSILKESSKKIKLKKEKNDIQEL